MKDRLIIDRLIIIVNRWTYKDRLIIKKSIVVYVLNNTLKIREMSLVI